MEQQNPQHRQPQKDDCEIEVRRTRSGMKMKISGKCSREQLEMFKNKGVLEDEG